MPHFAARESEVTHAQCWAHTRRGFEKAQDMEPDAVAENPDAGGELYRHEEHIRETGLSGEEKRAYRQAKSAPLVALFWRWCDQQCQRLDLTPSNPLSKALEVCDGTGGSAGSVSGQSGGSYRHQSSGAGFTLCSDG